VIRQPIIHRKVEEQDSCVIVFDHFAVLASCPKVGRGQAVLPSFDEGVIAEAECNSALRQQPAKPNDVHAYAALSAGTRARPVRKSAMFQALLCDADQGTP